MTDKEFIIWYLKEHHQLLDDAKLIDKNIVTDLPKLMLHQRIKLEYDIAELIKGGGIYKDMLHGLCNYYFENGIGRINNCFNKQYIGLTAYQLELNNKNSKLSKQMLYDAWVIRYLIAVKFDI